MEPKTIVSLSFLFLAAFSGIILILWMIISYFQNRRSLISNVLESLHHLSAILLIHKQQTLIKKTYEPYYRGSILGYQERINQLIENANQGCWTLACSSELNKIRNELNIQLLDDIYHIK